MEDALKDIGEEKVKSEVIGDRNAGIDTLAITAADEKNAVAISAQLISKVLASARVDQSSLAHIIDIVAKSNLTSATKSLVLQRASQAVSSVMMNLIAPPVELGYVGSSIVPLEPVYGTFQTLETMETIPSCFKLLQFTGPVGQKPMLVGEVMTINDFKDVYDINSCATFLVAGFFDKMIYSVDSIVAIPKNIGEGLIFNQQLAKLQIKGFVGSDPQREFVMATLVSIMQYVMSYAYKTMKIPIQGKITVHMGPLARRFRGQIAIPETTTALTGYKPPPATFDLMSLRTPALRQIIEHYDTIDNDLFRERFVMPAHNNADDRSLNGIPLEMTGNVFCDQYTMQLIKLAWLEYRRLQVTAQTYTTAFNSVAKWSDRVVNFARNPCYQIRACEYRLRMRHFLVEVSQAALDLELMKMKGLAKKILMSVVIEDRMLNNPSIGKMLNQIGTYRSAQTSPDFSLSMRAKLDGQPAVDFLADLIIYEAMAILRPIELTINGDYIMAEAGAMMDWIQGLLLHNFFQCLSQTSVLKLYAMGWWAFRNLWRTSNWNGTHMPPKIGDITADTPVPEVMGARNGPEMLVLYNSLFHDNHIGDESFVGSANWHVLLQSTRNPFTNVVNRGLAEYSRRPATGAEPNQDFVARWRTIFEVVITLLRRVPHARLVQNMVEILTSVMELGELVEPFFCVVVPYMRSLMRIHPISYRYSLSPWRELFDWMTVERQGWMFQTPTQNERIHQIPFNINLSSVNLWPMMFKLAVADQGGVDGSFKGDMIAMVQDLNSLKADQFALIMAERLARDRQSIFHQISVDMDMRVQSKRIMLSLFGLLRDSDASSQVLGNLRSMPFGKGVVEYLPDIRNLDRLNVMRNNAMVEYQIFSPEVTRAVVIGEELLAQQLTRLGIVKGFLFKRRKSQTEMIEPIILQRRFIEEIELNTSNGNERTVSITDAIVLTMGPLCNVDQPVYQPTEGITLTRLLEARPAIPIAMKMDQFVLLTSVNFRMELYDAIGRGEIDLYIDHYAFVSRPFASRSLVEDWASWIKWFEIPTYLPTVMMPVPLSNDLFSYTKVNWYVTPREYIKPVWHSLQNSEVTNDPLLDTGSERPNQPNLTNFQVWNNVTAELRMYNLVTALTNKALVESPFVN